MAVMTGPLSNITKAPDGPHRGLTPRDCSTPPVAVADEPGWQAEALTGMKASDKLARKAGVDPKVLAETERQEWE